MKSFLVLLTLLLTGCATSSDVFLADGTVGHNIQCGGTVMNYGDCLAKAGEICGAKGYAVVNKEGAASPMSMASGGFSADSQYASGGFSSTSGAMITRTLFVRCKQSDVSSKSSVEQPAK